MHPFNKGRRVEIIEQDDGLGNVLVGILGIT